jgi:hypothetical protein
VSVIYVTRSGVRVRIEARKREKARDGRWMWKGDAVRVDTGGRHGWLWMHLLKRES